MTSRVASGGSVTHSSPARILSLLGPVVLVAVGYMDPGNWATDLEAGSSFGFTLLWVLLAANLVALLLQHLSAKAGLATGMSYPRLCRAWLPRPLVIGLWLTAELAAIATDLAEFLGAALGFHLLLGLPLLPAALLTGLAVLAILALERVGVHTVEAAIFGLVAIVGAAYLFEVWLVAPDLAAAAEGALVPRLPPGALPIAMGMLGATVMPHNLYLHSSAVLPRRTGDRAHDVGLIRPSLVAAGVALTLAWLVNSAIVVTAAGAFGQAGLPIVSLEAAHRTLSPLLGPAAAAAFAIALLAAGLSSSTTATLAGQVILEGFLEVRISLLARRLVTMVPAILVLASGLDAYRILILSQVALAIQLPFAIVPLVVLTASRRVMGEAVNRRLTTAAGAIVAAAISGLNLLLLGSILADL